MLSLGSVLSKGTLQLFQSAVVNVPKTCPESIVTPVSLISQRWATKKAGGQARQKSKPHPRHYGPKFGDGELVFPGMMIMKQPKVVYFPGYNTGCARDRSIYAKLVGHVEYSLHKTEGGKTLRYIHVIPINDDWSPEYKQLSDEMVKRRAEIKREMLGKIIEPAFHFSLPTRNGRMSWLPKPQHNFPGTTTFPKAIEAPKASPKK